MAKSGSDPAIRTEEKRRTSISQNDLPRFALSEALRIAQALIDDHAGRATPPYLVAESVGLSVGSSNFRDLSSSSVAYGLTDGAAYADAMALTPLGRRAVAPTTEGDDVRAKIEAVLRPRVLNSFFTQYDRAKFPSDKVAPNILEQMGVPRDRVSDALELVKHNGELVGIIRQTKTGPFVALDGPISRADAGPADANGEYEVPTVTIEGVPEVVERLGITALSIPAPRIANNRVYISHGKDRAITGQIKEILKFGKLEPVLSVEKESLAIPVPDKVFEDMRSCSAGVIHVMSEGELLDPSGSRVNRINENVLIEIGAAIALYEKNVVLLVEKGVELPSNLKGLYRCDYEGDKLDCEATMKLLMTFNQFNLG
jgi:hypothetical protein